MTTERLPAQAHEGLHPTWSWCANCRRAYITGTYRVVRFSATRQHPFPQELAVCPYADCGGNLTRDQWRWTSIRAQHPQYPVWPEPGVRYDDRT